MSYLDSFIDSVRFLEKFDKEHREANADYNRLRKNIEHAITENHELRGFLSEKIDFIATSFIKNSTVEMANHCHSVSQSFYDNWMSQELGRLAPLGITIGNVIYKKKAVYNVSKSSIKKIITAGFDPYKSLELHVWLTFQNMMVLDFTIVPTLISKGLATLSDFDGKEYIVWSEGMESSLEYIPFLQDNNFMYRVDRIAGYA